MLAKIGAYRCPPNYVPGKGEAAASAGQTASDQAQSGGSVGNLVTQFQSMCEDSGERITGGIAQVETQTPHPQLAQSLIAQGRRHPLPLVAQSSEHFCTLNRYILWELPLNCNQL